MSNLWIDRSFSSTVLFFYGHWSDLRDVDDRGGRSHFFWLRLRSCTKIFESVSGNFQIWESDSCSDSGYHRSNWEFTYVFTLGNDHADSCYCRNGNMTPGSVCHKFLTPDSKEERRTLPESTPTHRIRGHLLWVPFDVICCRWSAATLHLYQDWLLNPTVYGRSWRNAETQCYLGYYSKYKFETVGLTFSNGLWYRQWLQNRLQIFKFEALLFDRLLFCDMTLINWQQRMTRVQ